MLGLEGLLVTDETAHLSEQGRETKIDANIPQTARVWDYWLGGTDNYAVDRDLGDQIAGEYPVIVDIARADRAVLNRAVRYLVGETGVRQILDIGTGLPTTNNTHEVAQAVAPQARIVYVDYDPLVLVHARALLTSGPEGATDYIDADLRDTETILREASRTLDFRQPVVLMLSGILAHLPTAEEAGTVVRRIMDNLAAGSFLVVVDGTDTNPELNEVMKIWNATANPPYAMRSPDEIASYFDGLELIEPGLVDVTRWRPDPDSAEIQPLHNLIGVGRKPAQRNTTAELSGMGPGGGSGFRASDAAPELVATSAPLRFTLGRFPDLTPYRPHPDTSQIETLSNQWARQRLGQFFPDTGQLEAYFATRPALWVCMCYPSAVPDRLLRICNINQCEFVLDDIFARDADVTADPEGARAKLATIRAVSAGATAPTDDDPLLHAYAEACSAVMDEAPSGLRARLLADIDSMYQAWEQENELRLTRSIAPPVGLEEMIEIRCRAAGLIWCLDLAEFGLGIDLTDILRHNTKMREFQRIAIRHMVLFGEIFSFRKEYFGGDGSNIIISLFGGDPAKLQEAVDLVHRMGVDAEHEFIAIRDEISASELGQNTAVSAYLDEISHMLAGVIRWEFLSPRYHGRGFQWDGKLSGTWLLTPDGTVVLPDHAPENP